MPGCAQSSPVKGSLWSNGIYQRQSTFYKFHFLDYWWSYKCSSVPDLFINFYLQPETRTWNARMKLQPCSAVALMSSTLIVNLVEVLILIFKKAFGGFLSATSASLSSAWNLLLPSLHCSQSVISPFSFTKLTASVCMVTTCSTYNNNQNNSLLLKPFKMLVALRKEYCFICWSWEMI